MGAGPSLSQRGLERRKRPSLELHFLYVGGTQRQKCRAWPGLWAVPRPLQSCGLALQSAFPLSAGRLAFGAWAAWAFLEEVFRSDSSDGCRKKQQQCKTLWAWIQRRMQAKLRLMVQSSGEEAAKHVPAPFLRGSAIENDTSPSSASSLCKYDEIRRPKILSDVAQEH